MSANQSQIVRNIQMELFTVETALSEFEAKRKELKAKLAKLGAGTKTCTKCGEEMGIEQFYRDDRYTDKRARWCCECKSEDVKARYHRRRAA